MLWSSYIELDALLSIIMLIVYGLISLRSKQVYLSDVFFFCRLFPLLFVLGFYLDTTTHTDFYSVLVNIVPTIDMLLAILLCLIMFNFNSFESVLLLVFAFVAQYYMLHSIDLMTFYIALEAQNFAFLVLCGLPSGFSYFQGQGKNNILGNKTNPSSAEQFNKPRHNNQGSMTMGRNSAFSVEAALKYFLLSAFSSGVILFWFSAIYLQTGLSVLSFKTVQAASLSDMDTVQTTSLHSFQILCGMMFKLGAAPLHLWVVQIYNGVKRNLIMYISTAPKLSLFGFWVGSFQTIWTDYSLLLFSAFSIALGAFGAYIQPTLRSLFAYSTVNEIGLLLSALETAGFHSLFQHLGIYIVSQLLLWNMADKRLFTVLAVSLAGLPPLAGFFGKAWIFYHVSSVGLYSLLLFALFCAAISLVYYLRVIRIFWNPSQNNITRTVQYSFSSMSAGQSSLHGTSRSSNAFSKQNHNNKFGTALYSIHSVVPVVSSRVQLTSACVVLLVIIPLFVIKPFVL